MLLWPDLEPRHICYLKNAFDPPVGGGRAKQGEQAEVSNEEAVDSADQIPAQEQQRNKREREKWGKAAAEFGTLPAKDSLDV